MYKVRSPETPGNSGNRLADLQIERVRLGSSEATKTEANKLNDGMERQHDALDEVDAALRFLASAVKYGWYEHRSHSHVSKLFSVASATRRQLDKRKNLER